MSTLTAAAEPAGADPAARPRVLLTVSGAAQGTVDVIRVTPDGSARLVPGGIKVTAGGAGRAFDYRAPFGVPVRYETLEQTSPGVSATVTLTSDDTWLIHPYAPSLSVRVQGSSTDSPEFTRDAFRQRSRPSSTALYEPLGRDDAIAVRVGRRRARLSSMTVRTWTLEQDTALDQLVEDDSPLLLNVPPQLRWGVPYQWVQLEQVDDVRLGREGAHEAREWVLPYRVVAEPVGELRAEWTSGDALEAFPTALAGERAYATSGDAEIDLRRSA